MEGGWRGRRLRCGKKMTDSSSEGLRAQEIKCDER